MFKKLRREITIYNTIVLFIFLVTFCTSIYIFLKSGIDYSVDRALRGRIANVERMDLERIRVPKNIVALPKAKDHTDISKRSLFDVKLRADVILFDEEGNSILNTSLYLEDYKDGFRELIGDYEHLDTKVKIDDKEFRVYIKKIYKDKTYYVMSINDYDTTYSILSSMLIVIISIGTIAMIILVFISRLFASRAIVPIQSSWAKQKKFVADASHELRTPLSVMQINLEAALSEPSSTIEDNKEWLENALEEASLMTNLVNDLLLLAKIDAKQEHYSMEIIDLSYVVNSAIDRIEDIACNHNIRILRDIDDGVIVHGDKNKLIQLITILIDNAIKYNEPKGSITITLSQSKGYADIAVKDTGIGIQDKNIDKVFDRFFMEDKARSKERGSSGLGLSIARWIVNIHKGKIWAESKKGIGTTIFVKLKTYDRD